MNALESAQACFTEWLHEVDALLIESQREHEKAMEALKTSDVKAFGEALGTMAGRIDQARAMFQTAFEAGFDEVQPS